MAPLAILVSYTTLVVFTFGQLLRLNFSGISFPMLDILILSLAIFNLLTLKTIKISNRSLLYFLIFSLISLLFNQSVYHYPLFKPFLYWLRLASLLSFFIFGKSQIIFTSRFQKLFNLVLISNILFGLIQYILWPDFTYFDALNWDPHLHRLVSTFFDPTFTGLIYLMFLISLFHLQSTICYLIIPYLGLSLTYSRSSLLAFLFSFGFFSFKTHRPRIFLASLIIVILTLILLPRQPGEGTKLERTNSLYAKIENYREGIQVFIRSPLVGVGYNHLAYVRNIDNPDSHANFGFDGSLLTILTTTGIVGFSLFIFGLFRLFTSSGLLFQSLLVAVLIHSFFANSLLYPWILIFLIIKYHK